MTPPSDFIVQTAIREAMHSTCRSQRGAVVFADGVVIGLGHNYRPDQACDGSQACKDTCRRTAVHAEQAAILDWFPRPAGSALAHVKVANGQLVTSGQPDCVECSKLIFAAGLEHVWLFHSSGWHGYTAADFHSRSMENAR